MDRNPRTVRERLIALLGKKVTIGTRDNHYVSGVVREVDGADVKLTVAGQPLVIATRTIDAVLEAPALQAEYVK